MTAPRWGRLATTVHSAAPDRSGRLHMFEYGEIGTTPTAPRLHAAVWLPHQFARVGCLSIDFLVWFIPATKTPHYSRVKFPFRGDHLYVLMALGMGPVLSKPEICRVGFSRMSTTFIAARRLGQDMALVVLYESRSPSSPSASGAAYAVWSDKFQQASPGELPVGRRLALALPSGLDRSPAHRPGRWRTSRLRPQDRTAALTRAGNRSPA